MKLKKLHVKNYRSLLNVEIDFVDGMPIIICGENNIGKTNFLRALNIFFNHIHDNELYIPSRDIPHHTYYGSQGSRMKTDFIATFEDEKSGEEKNVLVHFDRNGEPSYKVNGFSTSSDDVIEILEKFHCIFIESHNINLPSLIAKILEKDGLLALDKKRKKQSEPLVKLKEFIELSKEALKDIQKEINSCFKEMTDFDGVLQNTNILINFAEFEKLRDIVKTMTSITLQDGNNHEIESKGSGAQRAVFLSLMKYISKNIKDKKIIWAIDEPEAFLQPKLQRKVFNSLKSMSADDEQTIILTTHSQYFINLQRIESVNLFQGKSELKEYERRKGKIFHEIKTENLSFDSLSQKMKTIKEHLGIKSNDGWELLPFNILVEGESDKRYIELLLESLSLEIPNIIWSGGASKIGGYIQYYNNFARDNNFSSPPTILCIFDNDDEGRAQSQKVKPKNLRSLDIQMCGIPRFDGEEAKLNTNTSAKSNWEIEDFLPVDLFVSSVNSLLKKNGYKIIKKHQISARTQPAHSDKHILGYLSECISQNNPDKEDFKLDSDYRKREICQIFCNSHDLTTIQNSLTQPQKDFLEKLQLKV